MVTARIDEDDRERERGDDSNNGISDTIDGDEMVADLRLEVGAAAGPCNGKTVEVTVHNDGSLATSNVLVEVVCGGSERWRTGDRRSHHRRNHRTG